MRQPTARLRATPSTSSSCGSVTSAARAQPAPTRWSATATVASRHRRSRARTA